MAVPAFRRSKDLSERILRLRNYQSKDFWAMVFARPMTILMLAPVADLAWVTPNLITWLSVLSKAAGISALVAFPGYWGGIAGGLLVNLGLVLDNMDGTLARYRGTSSYLGYYLDKTVDIVCLAGLFGAIGLRAWWKSGEIFDLALPMAAFAGASIAGYCKWVSQRVETDLELRVRAKDGTLHQYAVKRSEQNPSQPPPERSFGAWMRFLAQAVKSIVYFNEVDIFFFLLLALILDREWIFTRWASGVYAAGAFIAPIYFYYQLRRTVRDKGLN